VGGGEHIFPGGGEPLGRDGVMKGKIITIKWIGMTYPYSSGTVSERGIVQLGTFRVELYGVFLIVEFSEILFSTEKGS
jgi:hypothetical protein